MSVFEILNAINVNNKTEKKNGLTYLSWAWAWGEAKKNFPEANYTIYENEKGWNYFTDGISCWVKTGVTIEGIEHIEYLPVMDYRNKSIPAGNVTSFDVNKTIQRSLTKALARHGLGLYIYAGEDLPEEEINSDQKNPDSKPEQKISEQMQRDIISKIASYAEIKNGDGDELLKYYLTKLKVNSISELTQSQGTILDKEVTKLLERSSNQ